MFTPSIGQEGVYKVRAPFDKLIERSVIYTCQSIRSMNELVGSGVDPWKTHYEPYGASDTDFRADVAANVNIVTLLAGTGNWVHVPASFIEGAPNASGEKFTPAMVSAYLGHVPESLNFEAIVDQIKGVIQKQVGIDPEVKLIGMGPSVLLTDDEVARINTARTALMGSKPESMHAQNMRLQAEVTRLNTLVAELNKFIANKSL